MGKGLSNSEEKARRHAVKERDKVSIELYHKHRPCLHVDSVDLCSALRRENPKLARVFDQIDASQGKAKDCSLGPEKP